MISRRQLVNILYETRDQLGQWPGADSRLLIAALVLLSSHDPWIEGLVTGLITTTAPVTKRENN